MQVFHSVKLVFAFDANPKIAENFAYKLSKELGIKIEPHSKLEDATLQSDIVITCTPSKQHYLLTRFISPGTFVAAVGADSPDKQELEPSLLVGNKVVVDILEQCAAAGELHHALEQGLMRETEVYAEISDIIAGKVLGRTSESEIIIFDTTGTAIQDIATAAAVFQKAIAKGVGTYLAG